MLKIFNYFKVTLFTRIKQNKGHFNMGLRSYFYNIAYIILIIVPL